MLQRIRLLHATNEKKLFVWRCDFSDLISNILMRNFDFDFDHADVDVPLHTHQVLNADVGTIAGCQPNGIDAACYETSISWSCNTSLFQSRLHVAVRCRSFHRVAGWLETRTSRKMAPSKTVRRSTKANLRSLNFSIITWSVLKDWQWPVSVRICSHAVC